MKMCSLSVAGVCRPALTAGPGRGLLCPLPDPGTLRLAVRAPPDLAQPAPL